MKLYHGTSRGKLAEIEQLGLKNPYLTDLLEIAEYYAEAQGDEDGTEAVVLEVEVEDTNLQYDYVAMEEPVLVSDSDRDEGWEQISGDHPEWVEDNMLTVPSFAWQYSLQFVHSVKYQGLISSDKFSEV